jgi:predicted nucleotidyltransferase
MLTSKQLKLFGLFSKNPFNEITFKDLKEYSGEKSNSLVQNAIRRFIQEELIKQRSIGTSKLYSLNHDNPKIYYYLGLYSYDVLPKAAIKSVMQVKDAVEKEEQYYSIVVFGSYANNKYSKKSDIDIAIFIQNEKSKRKIEVLLSSVSNKSLIELDCHIIISDEFGELLMADYANLGKEIVSKNLPIINPSIFYSLILNSIRHGYNPLS